MIVEDMGKARAESPAVSTVRAMTTQPRLLINLPSTFFTRPELAPYLERFDLASHRTQRVKELSKGMQQKAQLISTVLHNPELIIIDNRSRLSSSIMAVDRPQGCGYNTSSLSQNPQ